MKGNKKYLVAVALLAVLAVVFGLAGTVAPVSELASPRQSSSSSSSSTHFMYPPTYDSDWVDIREKAGQYVTLSHGLNTTQVFVDITGKQSLNVSGGACAWSRICGGASDDAAYSVVQTVDGGYALAGYTLSYGAGGADSWLVKTATESGLVMTGLANYNIILYRGKTDPYWNYVRVRIWLIQEPTWQFGDIDMDGDVDYDDFIILAGNYGRTLSALSLTGIIATAGIYTYKKREQPK